MVDLLGDRAKKYEIASGCYDIFPPRMPILVRIDGKSFHSWTKGCKRPFDESLISAMNNVAIKLCYEIQGAQIAFVQSDEITILIHSYKKLDSQPWLGGRKQKIESVSASIAGATMTLESINVFGKYKPAYFDSRIFIVPENDVNNMFLWRENDASRNSISSVAQSMYFHKELHKKNSKELQEMIYKKSGQNWNDLPIYLKRGRCVVKSEYEVDGVKRNKWVVDNEIPFFSQDKNYIEKYLKTEE